MSRFFSSQRSDLFRPVVATWLLGVALALPSSLEAQVVVDPRPIAPPNDLMFQYPAAQPRPRLVQTSLLIRVATVRSTYNVNGAGLTCAVLDTGARTSHVDFAGAGKIPAQKNFTADNGGDQNNAADGHGHGTNVGGIVCANGIHTGIAPGARMIPIKVLANSGGGSTSGIISGLDWVIANRATYNITCVNMSLGVGSNETSDASYTNDALRQRLVTLRNARVAVCIAAGNSFGDFASQEGMGYPAILREGISVGATYDSDAGPFSYGAAIAFTTGPKRVTPFSQRLHSSTSSTARTDTFAPGAPLTSAGIISDTGESTQHGTSQATPVVAGLVLLAQQYHLARTGQLPTIDKLESWLRRTTSQIVDGDDEDDNVINTNKSYFFADAVELFQGIVADIGAGTTNNNVVATYNATTKKLTLTGDANSNSVSVSYKLAGTSPVTPENRIIVKGLNGTKVNNKTADQTTDHQWYAHTGPLDIGAVMSNGDDSVDVIGVNCPQLYLNLGNGSDKVTLKMCTAVKLNIDGGTGNDYLIKLMLATNAIPTSPPNLVIKNVENEVGLPDLLP